MRLGLGRRNWWGQGQGQDRYAEHGSVLGSSSFLYLDWFLSLYLSSCCSHKLLLITQGPPWILLLFLCLFFDFHLLSLFLSTPYTYAYMYLFLSSYHMDWRYSPGNIRVQMFLDFSSFPGGKLYQSRKSLVHPFTSRVYHCSKEENQMSCSDCFIFKGRQFITRRERGSILGKLAFSHNLLCWPLGLLGQFWSGPCLSPFYWR